jgi:phosphohistidine phosphatase SixA
MVVIVVMAIFGHERYPLTSSRGKLVKKNTVRLLPLLLLSLSAGIVFDQRVMLAQQSEPPTVVIVVRHAEKGEGNDPALTQAGVARTQALVDAVAGADVSAVYATQYKRTRQTVEPLAARVGTGVTEIPITAENADSYASMLAHDILSKHRGKTVVVAGHSNTVPAIVEALGSRPIPAIDESQYDLLYIVIIPSAGPPRVIATRYGRGKEEG